MQKCNYRSENNYFQVEQFTSRSFKVRSIFHTSSWTQHNNVPVSKSMETVQENRSTQNTTCALFSKKTGHFHRRTFSHLQSISIASLWFAPIEVPYVPEQANISKSEKSTCNLTRRKLSKNKNLLSQEYYESNRDFLARIARLDLSPRSFNIFYNDIITL